MSNLSFNPSIPMVCREVEFRETVCFGDKKINISTNSLRTYCLFVISDNCFVDSSRCVV